jgi:hypothetical protein
MWAAANGNTHCVRLLLDAGADKNAKDDVRLLVGFAVYACARLSYLFGASASGFMYANVIGDFAEETYAIALSIPHTFMRK